MRRILSALLLLLALAPQTARADEGIAVFSGLTTGIGFLHQGLDSPGWTIGGEVSAVYYSEDINILSGDGDVWAAGGYVDALWDFGSDSLRVSMGPELVWFFFGIDGGYLLQLHDGRAGHGIAGRVFISFIVPSLYARVGSTWGEVDDMFVEIGITLKIPPVQAFF